MQQLGGGDTGIKWLEARDACQTPIPKTVHHSRELTWPGMSLVPKLRSPGLGS